MDIRKEDFLVLEIIERLQPAAGRRALAERRGGLIPSLSKFASCGGFPNRHLSDSPWQTTFERFAMSTPVPLRSDFDAIGLRMLARRSRGPDQTRRLLASEAGVRPPEIRFGRFEEGRSAMQMALAVPVPFDVDALKDLA